VGFKADFKHNIIVKNYGPVLFADTLPETNTFVDDLSKIYAAIGSGSWDFVKNSPAIAAGVKLDGVTLGDIDDNAWADDMDCGPFAHKRETKLEETDDTLATGAALAAYTFQKPTPIPARNARPFFKHLQEEPQHVLNGQDFTGQEGGSVRIKEQFKSIFGWDHKDHWLEWSFDGVEAGTYEICVNVTTGTSATRSFIINGKKIEALHASRMTYTGGWRQWTDHYVDYQFTLVDGTNTIRLNNESGSLNVKNLRLYKITF
ncbi:MAG: hypothetical protein HRU15_10165, partial [Planctomycetes bacterium]|nr:hypothetical protein [Planctomycetota bacterium]